VFHVVVVAGVALGWGTEFLLTADYRIGAPGARFSLPETGLGILPGAGGTSELWRHIGVGHALRLGMTGEMVGLDEALRIGLLQEAMDSEEAAMARALALAARVVTRSPTANAAFKRGVLEAAGCSREARETLEADAYDLCVTHGDAAIGRANFASIRRGEAPPWNPRSRDVEG
jgi:enoyl-CoA hydratase/carnithine racemase